MSAEDPLSTSCEQSFTGCAALLGHLVRLILVGLLLTAGILTLPAARASASRVVASSPVVISGTDLLLEKCDEGAPKNGWRDWEEEPTLAVNPTNPQNLVSAWIQDFSDGIEVGYSTDGGRTWNTSLPPTDTCTGGIPSTESAIDPSLSFGPSSGPLSSQGIAFLASFVFAGKPTPFAIIVNRSLDGGATWSKPLELDTAQFPETFITENVAADPVRPGYAYTWWSKTNVANAQSNTVKQFVSHTTNEGVSWSAPTQIPSSQSGFPYWGRLLVLPPTAAAPEGTLVDVFGEIPGQTLREPGPGEPAEPPYPFSGKNVPPHGPTRVLATRSTDLGEHWSAPVAIALADPTLLANVGAALAPDGKTIYVTWQRVAADKSSFSLMYSKSRDGGLTWLRKPGLVGGSIPGPAEYGDHGYLAYLTAAPSVAVAPDGTVGVTFYDHRYDPGNKPARITDLWLRSSRNGGKSWKKEDLLLAGPFDQTTAPGEGPRGGEVESGANIHCKEPNCIPPEKAVEGFLGDYQGMIPIAGGFANTFALAEPLAGAKFKLTGIEGKTLLNPEGALSNPTDIFFDTVGRHRRHTH